MRPVLLNTVPVDSPLGTRRFDLLLGDVCDASADLLAISTHANPELKLAGLVLDALRARHGAEIAGLEPLLMVRASTGTYRARCTAPVPFDEVLVVRTPGAHAVMDSGDEPLEVYRRVVWSLFGSIAALELEGAAYRRLALPVLGGQRDYDVTSALGILLEQAIRWLERSRYMEQVALYVVDPAIADQWDVAINAVLGRRPIVGARAEVSGALCGEILAQARELLEIDVERQRAYEAVVAALDRRPVYLQQVAAAARIVTEHLVRALCERTSIEWEGNLYADIEHVRERGKVAPWITAYFHALRVFGNEELHVRSGVSYDPKALEDGDLVAMLGALQRVLAYWKNRRTVAPGRS